MVEPGGPPNPSSAAKTIVDMQKRIDYKSSLNKTFKITQFKIAYKIHG
ncbi:hypothetical protein KPL47_02675 [Clostridium estertheticum]|nr:hypothetical protein [Clostridium estertheticum]MBU3175267.1 hypothetical protein [Clostridium estertheticum]